MILLRHLGVKIIQTESRTVAAGGGGGGNGGLFNGHRVLALQDEELCGRTVVTAAQRDNRVRRR